MTFIQTCYKYWNHLESTSCQRVMKNTHRSRQTLTTSGGGGGGGGDGAGGTNASADTSGEALPVAQNLMVSTYHTSCLLPDARYLRLMDGSSLSHLILNPVDLLADRRTWKPINLPCVTSKGCSHVAHKKQLEYLSREVHIIFKQELVVQHLRTINHKSFSHIQHPL